jgi:hypothetical protein
VRPDDGIASDALVLIAGAGMAGLCAAARARELGASPVVLEKGSRPGGSMLLSSCVVWRYRTFEEFRAECPGGDEELQRTVFDGFDDALEWLVSLGPEVVWEDTPNPRSTGKRFEPRSLTEALVRAAGDVQTGQVLGTVIEDGRAGQAGTASLVGVASERLRAWPKEPVVLATGGFAVRYALEHGLLVRCNPWSEGDGLDFAQGHGARLAGDLDEFYGRAMPAPPARIHEEDYVRLSQLWGGEARVLNERGEEFFPGPPAWHESDLAQAIARQPGGTAWFVVSADHRDRFERPCRRRRRALRSRRRRRRDFDRRLLEWPGRRARPRPDRGRIGSQLTGCR